MNTTTPTKPRSAYDDLRSVDRELLEALRGGDRLGMTALTAALAVTATAVRQRLERLLEDGLIQRHKVIAGRGRPTYSYSLTVEGHRLAGADQGALADALWQEILLIDDANLRARLLAGAARRLGRSFKGQLSSQCQNGSLETRMRELSKVMAGRRIPNDVTISGLGALPVLGITACPYPDLTDASEQRSMCHLEEEMLSEALGRPVELTSCRLDGDHCCQFSPKE